MLKRLCSGLGRLTVMKTRLANGGPLAKLTAKCLWFVAVGEHHDPGVAAFLNFDWYSPAYRSRHSVEDLRQWYSAAGFNPPTVLPEPVSAIAVKR